MGLFPELGTQGGDRRGMTGTGDTHTHPHPHTHTHRINNYEVMLTIKSF